MLHPQLVMQIGGKCRSSLDLELDSADVTGQLGWIELHVGRVDCH
jgi:hypothetical protein